MPRQYVLIRAAKKLGCSVFELLRQPKDTEYGDWIEWAIIAERADNIVKAELAELDEDDYED